MFDVTCKGLNNHSLALTLSCKNLVIVRGQYHPTPECIEDVPILRDFLGPKSGNIRYHPRVCFVLSFKDGCFKFLSVRSHNFDAQMERDVAFQSEGMSLRS